MVALSVFARCSSLLRGWLHGTGAAAGMPFSDDSLGVYVTGYHRYSYWMGRPRVVADEGRRLVLRFQ